MTVPRATFAKSLKEGAEKVELFEGFAGRRGEGEIRRILASLPDRDVRWSHRVITVMIIAFFALLTVAQIVELLANPEVGLLRDVIAICITVLLLIRIARFDGIAYGWGVLWVVFGIIHGFEEFRALPSYEREDPVMIGWFIVMLILALVTCIGLIFLKRELFPHQDWLRYRRGESGALEFTGGHR
jgi:hypothetical protein